MSKRYNSQVGGEAEKEIRTNRCCRSATFAAAILAVIVAALGAGFGIAAYSYYGYFNNYLSIRGSGLLPTTPYVFYVDSSAIPAAMILPNNLAPYVGNVYRVWSRTSQAHTITIQGLGSTFNGGATTATFGGAIGDGLEFEVISANFIRVISAVNVVFV
jgi:hypothetical protein